MRRLAVTPWRLTNSRGPTTVACVPPPLVALVRRMTDLSRWRSVLAEPCLPPPCLTFLSLTTVLVVEVDRGRQAGSCVQQSWLCS